MRTEIAESFVCEILKKHAISVQNLPSTLKIIDSHSRKSVSVASETCWRIKSISDTCLHARRSSVDISTTYLSLLLKGSNYQQLSVSYFVGNNIFRFENIRTFVFGFKPRALIQLCAGCHIWSFCIWMI